VVEVLDGDAPGPDNEGDQTLTVTEISDAPANGSVSIAGDAITYTPNADFTGTDTFGYRVCDSGSPRRCDTATVTVTVDPVNDGPTAETDVYEIDEDQTLDVGAAEGLLANDHDIDGGDLRIVDADENTDGVQPVSGPSSGTLTLNEDGSFTYDPNPEFSGTDEFTYRVSDGNGGTDTAVAVISTNEINDPPEADDGSYSVDEDGTLETAAPGLLEGVTDEDNDPPTVEDADGNTPGVQPVRDVQHGSLTLNEDGSFVYRPDPDFNGADSFVYRVSDGRGGTDEATVRISVEPVNDAPVAENDRRTIPEDQVLNFPANELFQNDSAGPGEGDQTLTITRVFGARDGSVELRDGRVIFTPARDFFGTASFSYEVCDDGDPERCATAAVNIVDVTPINDPAVAAGDTATTDEDAATDIDVRANDSTGPQNEDDQTLTVTEITARPGNGTVSINGGNNITYTPDPDFNGTDTFEYRVCDSGEPNRCDDAMVTVTVDAVNDGPVSAVPREPQRTSEEKAVVFSRVNGNSVSVSDPDSENANVTVRLSVPESTGTITLGGTTDVVVEGDGTRAVTVTGSVDAVNEVLDGLRFDPAANYNGPAALTVATDDGGNVGSGGALIDEDTVDIQIEGVNDAPTIDAIGDRTTDEDTATGAIEFGIADVETGAGALVVTATSSDEELVPEGNIRIGGSGANRTISVTPAQNRTGATTITLTVRDADGVETVETFVLTVAPVNDEPTNDVPGAQETGEDSPLVFSPGNGNRISISDPDADDGDVRVTLGVPEGAGTLTVGGQSGVEVAGSGTNEVVLTGTVADIVAALDGLRFDPAPDTNGPVILTITTDDGGNTGSGGPLTDEDTVEIQVRAANDAPTFKLPEDPRQTADEDAGPQTVSGFATDVSPGPNEDQGLRFRVTDDNGDLFAAGGRPAVSPEGTLTYTPARNANGVATVTVVAIDDAGTPDDPADDVEGEPRTFTITIEPVNDPPEISSIEDRTVDEEGTAGPIGFDVGDVETAAGALTLSATSSNPDLVPGASVTFGGDGANRTVSVEPVADRNGTATITVRVRDAQGREATETFTVTVEPVNDEPTAENDARTTNEDEPLVFAASGLVGNDSAGPGEGDQALAVERVGDAQNGTVALRNGQITFTPDPDFNGEASFEYTVSDGEGGTATATVTVSVSGVNDAPTIDLNGAGAGTGYSGSFTEGDDPAPAVGPDALDAADADNGTLRSATAALANRPDGDAERLDAYTNGSGISADYDPDTGILTLTGPASVEEFRRILRGITYTNASRNPTEGARQIDFTVEDGDRQSERATSTVSVAAVNDAPEIVLPGGPLVYNEGDAATVIDGGVTVGDPDSPNFGGGRLSVDLIEGATAADRLGIQPQGDLSLQGNVVSYNGGPIGTFAGGDGSDPLVVTFNESATTEAVQALLGSIAFSVDSDSPSERPRAVRYVVTDGDGGQSEAATQRISVTGVNDAPVVDLNGTTEGLDSTSDFAEDGGPVIVGDAGALAVADSDDANIDGATVTLTNRPDGDDAESLTADVSGTGISADYDRATGMLTLSGPASKAAYRDVLRTVAYDNASQNPSTTARRVEFVVNDGDLESGIAAGTINVSAAPDSPEAANDASRAEEGGDPVLVDVLGNDGDPENDTLTVTAVTQPPEGEGTVELISDGPDAGSVRFTPDADFGGETTFTYTISDGNGGTSTATVTVTVAATNDPPTARDDELNMSEDAEAVTVDVLGNDTDDPDTDETLTVQSVGATSGGGTVEILDGGTAVRYRPARNFAGTETFEYTVSDGNSGTDTATVTVIVGGDNDAPEIGNIGERVSYTENRPAVLVAPGATIDDPDSADFGGGALTVALTDNGQPGGRLAVRNVGDGGGEIGVSGETVSYGGTPIGTVSGGEEPDAPLTVSLNEGATPEAVQALLRNVVYRNVSEDPSDQVRTISFTLTDGDGGTGTSRKPLAVIPVNDPPVVELTQAPGSATEGETVAYEFSVTDPDSDGFSVADGFPDCGEGGELVDGSLSPTPTGGGFRCRFSDGPASPTVSIRVEDQEGAQSNTASRSVEVENAAPQADTDGPYEATEDTNLEVAAEDGVLSGDTDAGADDIEAVLVQGPPEDAGELTLDPNGSFVFRPADGYNGRASFTYRACEVGDDGEVCSEEIQVNIGVAAVNDAPTAANDAATVREDGSVRIGVIGNDVDPDGEGDLDPASVRIISGPENGRATPNGDGSVSYVPENNFNGADSFVYEVCDRAGECARATANVTVDPVNDAPLARDDAVATSEDTPLRIPQADLLDNDATGPANEGGQALRITSVSGARNGTVRLADNGDVVFTPVPGYNGPASFVYTVTDGQGNTDTATANVDVDVSSVNDEPVGEADAATTGEDEAVTIDVLANDTDPESDPLSVVEGSLTQPANGTVEVVDGNIRYTPRENFNGTDTFLYRMADGQGGTGAPVRVTVTVEPANDAPVGNPDSYATDEDSPISRDAPGVLANDTDAEDEEGLTVRLADDVQNGALTLNEDGSFTYTPDNNFNGRDSFTYVVVDADGEESEPVTVTLAVAVGNDAPEATDDEETTQEDSPVTIDALGNDADPDNDALSIRDVGTPENGTAEVRGGEILYTPDANFNGTDTFEYTVVDANGATSTATITVTVEAVNDAPVARNDGVTTVEDTPLRIPQSDLLGNDVPGPPNEDGQLRVTAVGNARNGTVRLDDNGDVVFTPAPGYSGPASFVYTVTDNSGNTDTATANVDVTVDPVNDAPEAVNDRFETGEDLATTLDVLANDTDPEGELDAGSVEVITAPQNGETTISDGAITYNPRANFNGTDTLVYRVCDSGDPRECDTATVEILVGAANDAPTANDDAETTGEDTPVTVDVLANDEDPEGREELDPSTVEVTANPASGTTSVGDDGSITYRPNDDTFGTDVFTYRVCDTGEPQQCASATVEITVEQANDDPTAAADSAQADEGGPVILMDVLANDSADPDRGETLTVSRVTQPPNGQGAVEVVPEGQPNAGKLRFTPGADFGGQTTFEYTISDGNGGTSTATVTVSVAPTNDDPTTANDAAEAAEGGQPVRIDVLGNDRIAPDEGETLTIVDFTQPPGGRGTVALDGDRLVYTPNDDFSGQATFTYTVDDGNGGRSTATVTVNVAPENDPPRARPDTRTVAEDETLLLPFDDLTLNDAAGDAGQSLTITEVGNAQNGTVGIRAGRVAFTPAPEFSGEASFTYTVCDDGSPRECDTTTVAVAVTAVNDAPVAAERVVSTSEEEQIVVDVTSGDRPGPENESSQSLTVTNVTRPSNGTVIVVPTGEAGAGQVRYVPNPNFTGRDSFVYTVCDDGNPRECDTATVTVNVGSVNDLLAAGDDTSTTAEEGPVNINVLGNDRDDDGLDRASVAIATQPASGTVRVLANGTIRYAPRANFSGTDTFQYRVCDLSDPAECTTATVEVTVTDVNDAPSAVDDEATTGEQEPVNIGVVANDGDPEGRLDPGSVTVTRNPSNGRVRIGEGGAVVYTPRAGFSGTDTFDYEVCDAESEALCATATVTVRVRPAPADPPRADAVISTSAPNRVTVGQRFAYTINVANRGPDTAQNVILRSNVPRAVTFVSAPNCTYAAGQRRLTCNLGDLGRGDTRSRKVNVRAARAGDTTLRASISSDTQDPVPNNNDAGG
jgi:large repetitive protein